MDSTRENMDKATMDALPVQRERRFRTPLRVERAVGLWVDRIGAGVDQRRPKRLRELGQYAAVYVESGRGYFSSPTMGTVCAEAGDVMFLFPDEPACYFPEQRWVQKYIVWNGPDAAALEEIGYVSRQRMIVADRTQAVARAYGALAELMGDEDMAAVLARKNTVLQMVLELFKSGRSPGGRASGDRVMKEAAAFLGEHYREEMAVPELARRFGLSTTHFRRRFKEFTGRGPREFVTALRISQAKELLSRGKRVKEAARAVGYEDAFYFMRLFKKVVGVSAGRFSKAEV